jgi:hypothetical protein
MRGFVRLIQAVSNLRANNRLFLSEIGKPLVINVVYIVLGTATDEGFAVLPIKTQYYGTVKF